MLIPKFKIAFTAQVLRDVFNLHKGVDIIDLDNFLEPEDVGLKLINNSEQISIPEATIGDHPEQNKAEKTQVAEARCDVDGFVQVSEIPEVKGIPEQWKHPKARQKIERMCQDAVNKMVDGDFFTLAGGRDVLPELFGQQRHEKTQACSILDVRDPVEIYSVMTAIAHGKTVHANCRGFQLLTNLMLNIFADEKIDFRQHLPEYFERNGIKNTDHHSGTEIYNGAVEIMKKEGWSRALIDQQLKDEESYFSNIPSAFHDVCLIKKCLLSDALMIENKGIDNLDKGPVHINLVSVHHQGFAFVKDSKELENFLSALKKAGGTVVGYSAHDKDEHVGVIEATSFSKKIDSEAVDKIKVFWNKLNSLLGIDVKFVEPDLSKPLRFDAPHSAQSHPELDVGGVSQATQALTLKFIRDKKFALEKGQDIRGYFHWSEDKEPQELIRINVKDPITYGFDGRE